MSNGGAAGQIPGGGGQQPQQPPPMQQFPQGTNNSAFMQYMLPQMAQRSYGAPQGYQPQQMMNPQQRSPWGMPMQQQQQMNPYQRFGQMMQNPMQRQPVPQQQNAQQQLGMNFPGGGMFAQPQQQNPEQRFPMQYTNSPGSNNASMMMPQVGNPQGMGDLMRMMGQPQQPTGLQMPQQQPTGLQMPQQQQPQLASQNAMGMGYSAANNGGSTATMSADAFARMNATPQAQQPIQQAPLSTDQRLQLLQQEINQPGRSPEAMAQMQRTYDQLLQRQQANLPMGEPLQPQGLAALPQQAPTSSPGATGGTATWSPPPPPMPMDPYRGDGGGA